MDKEGTALVEKLKRRVTPMKKHRTKLDENRPSILEQSRSQEEFCASASSMEGLIIKHSPRIKENNEDFRFEQPYEPVNIEQQQSGRESMTTEGFTKLPNNLMHIVSITQSVSIKSNEPSASAYTSPANKDLDFSKESRFNSTLLPSLRQE